MVVWRKGILLGFSLAFVLGATFGGEAGVRRARRKPFYVRAHVVRAEAAASHSKRRKRFDAYKTHTIEFDVVARNRSQNLQPTKLNLYLPNGDLYQTIELESYDGRPRRLRATGRLPVSGTYITRYQLYGKWTADVCWDAGGEQSCARGLRFVLQR